MDLLDRQTSNSSSGIRSHARNVRQSRPIVEKRQNPLIVEMLIFVHTTEITANSSLYSYNSLTSSLCLHLWNAPTYLRQYSLPSNGWNRCFRYCFGLLLFCRGAIRFCTHEAQALSRGRCHIATRSPTVTVVRML